MFFGRDKLDHFCYVESHTKCKIKQIHRVFAEFLFLFKNKAGETLKKISRSKYLVTLFFNSKATFVFLS